MNAFHPTSRSRRWQSALLAALLVGASAPSLATVYRCGQTYQQTPCEGGKTVDLPPPPSAADVQAAQDRAAAQRQWVDGMEADRLAQEKAQTKAQRGQARRQHKAGHAATDQAADGGTPPIDVVVGCPEPLVRKAGALSEADMRRHRQAAARCGLPAYAAPAASAPVKKKADSARQPAPASAAAAMR